MIDLELIRDETQRVKVVDSERRRGRCTTVGGVVKSELVDTVLAEDNLWKECLQKINALRTERNSITKTIKEKMKGMKAADADKDAITAEVDALKARVLSIKDDIAKLDVDTTEHLRLRDVALNKIGNILLAPPSDLYDSKDYDLHDLSYRHTNGEEQIRVGADEPAEWGKAPETPLNHVQLMTKADMINCDDGVKVAGARGYYLKGAGARLNQALINYAMDFLENREHEVMDKTKDAEGNVTFTPTGKMANSAYEVTQTPFFMKGDMMAKCAQLEQFEEELYKVVAGTRSTASKDPDLAGDRFLIATSEQPLCAMHADKIITAKEMPIRLCGYSTCFRMEAGRHGENMAGIFRIHQFEKVEQFVIAHPEDAEVEFTRMVAAARDFYQSLDIPFRVVQIASDDINNAAAIKNDLEAYFPEAGEYRELVSVSNCTDYQSRGLNTRMAHKGKDYVHMLNGTMTATERTMCCLVENYQRGNGIVVPKKLRPYMGGRVFIPFKK
ncbi:Serine-tRNA ligase, type1 [Carpediemonas membranifera]|uniref:serine--tRNA ligase n=1 Tax=Carpediemonas membranifera TaxID=201153 RepID=A0A8J6EAA0_9EUKA|nr:Serine-tRNA ligase, type1 [Carpediemonas membranifera]|eukprot:KAG9394405.1 Serine-tRNA ligase, type1 [Carpediemonas membranifera]